MDILSWTKKKFENMNDADYIIFLIIIAIAIVILSSGYVTFVSINGKPNTAPIESTNTLPVVPQTSPLSSQTIDINVNPDPTTISNSKSNLPFRQEINISGTNATITINNYDGNVK